LNCALNTRSSEVFSKKVKAGVIGRICAVKRPHAISATLPLVVTNPRGKATQDFFEHLNVDHFEAFNDSHGHRKIDTALASRGGRDQGFRG
jgi:hypothetical protein